MTTLAHTDMQSMQRALAHARAATGLASPNPTIGCVLVRDGRIVGEGAHQYDARDHAEIVALQQAGLSAAGATAYVTLEPCSHTGRTGPCADALITARIARAVVATLDPNPAVCGRGIARLRSAGIAVEVGLCEAEARSLNDGFARFIQTQMPFVTLKVALSSDGYSAPPPGTHTERKTYWLTGAAARNHVQQMRHASGALLTGIGTILADDPALTDRSGLPRRRRLLRAVLDSQLALPPDSQIIDNGDVLLFCSPTAYPERASELARRGVQIVRIPVLGDGRLDLNIALAHLASRQILNVLVEAGPRLNGSLLRAALVDKAVLFHAPLALGPGSLPFADGVALAKFEQSLQHQRRTPIGEDVCVSGYVHDPWPHRTLTTDN